MIKHPLTYDICEQLAYDTCVQLGDPEQYDFRTDDMDIMQAAADWQLAKCLNYIRLTYGDEAMVPFMEAMRPTKKYKR